MVRDSTCEQLLQDLEARYQGLIQAAVDGIVIIDRHGLIEAFNPAAERIFKYPAAAVIGRNVSMLMPEPDASRHDGYLDHYARTGEARIIGIGREVMGRRADGSLFPLDLAVGAVRSPEGLKFVGFVRDITHRKEIEHALQSREQEIRQVVENAPIGIFTAELPGIIRSANPALLRLLRCEATQLVGASFAGLLADDDYRRLTAALAQLVAGASDEQRVEDLRWRRRDGAWLDVSLHLGSVSIAQASPLIVGQVVDRTEKVRSEEAARQARAQLAHVGRLTTLGEMASAIAHEVNQPLTAIAAHAQACRRLINAGDSDLATFAGACDQIAEQALRAGQVVKQIRAFVTKRDSGKESADLNEVLRAILELAIGDAREASVKVETELAPALPAVFVDRVQMQQVFLNLIRNAIDAMRAQPQSERLLIIRSRAAEGGLEISFEDRGGGVPPGIRDRLFHPFFTTKSDGMGMGLSISRSIVAAHGGTLQYSDTGQGGACFTVALPAAAS